MTLRVALSALERATISAAMVAAILGTAAWGLTAPPVTSALVGRYYDRASGLDERTALETAELVRRFVSESGPPALPVQVAGRPAFDPAAVAHLMDVRRVLNAAGVAAAAAWAVFALWCGVSVATGRAERIGLVLRSGGLAAVAVCAVAFAVGALDFERLFAAFHGLFFPAGTWTFPAGALLIQLFPESVWMALGLAWAALTAASGLVLAAASFPLRSLLVCRSVPQTPKVV